MLLGIVLHGMLSFLEIPAWPAQDVSRDSAVFAPWLHAIHGFRMPLFFLLSGFFTTMLWRRRGLAALLSHRAKRILLPLVLGTLVVCPLQLAIGAWGQAKKERLSLASAPQDASAAVLVSSAEPTGAASGTERSPRLRGIVRILVVGAFLPVFHHLWFLHYLVWMVAGFALVAWAGSRAGWERTPRWMVASPWAVLWWFPLAWIPQLFMVRTFGPDTAAGLLPWPPKLLYYAAFFAFGALWHDVREDPARRRHASWIVPFLLAVPLLLAGIRFHEARGADFLRSHVLSTLCAAAYAWLMSFALLGAFRQFGAAENRAARYVSDASYWLYVAHLPVIVSLQIVVSDWPGPAALKLALLVSVTTGVLLLAYEFGVRHTFVGTLLNGPRPRR
jgi:peptidoglycan/LPS O-acetylase OafA/YrhL